jgi:hypothetical protein
MAKPENPRAKLAKVLPLLGSDKAGEVVAAAAAAHRILVKAGLSWPEILALEPHRGEPLLGVGRQTCAQLQKRPGDLRVWERKFVSDLPRFHGISTKQRYILAEIATRAREIRDPFSTAVVEALRLAHPEAFTS